MPAACVDRDSDVSRYSTRLHNHHVVRHFPLRTKTRTSDNDAAVTACVRTLQREKETATSMRASPITA